jgi:polyphosphate kinase 2 (PPK2 family)
MNVNSGAALGGVR